MAEKNPHGAANTEQPAEEPPEPISLKSFFESVPPGRKVHVPDAFGWVGVEHATLRRIDIELHCSTRTCDGARVWSNEWPMPQLSGSEANYEFTYYRCRNCQDSIKVFALRVLLAGPSKSTLEKLGEFPPFGPLTPARVTTLIGPDRDLFLKGRRCENQGLGIGAFGYFRRVVENQKHRIFDEIARVAVKVGAASELLEELNAAKRERQFSTAIDKIKHALPQVLMIGDRNPLLLLHSALSEGLHNQSDADCLEYASAIRTVLADLADRAAQALKDHAELQNAVAVLERAQQRKRTQQSNEE